MFSTQHKKSPVRLATLPPPSQSTQPLSPPDCGHCDTAPCLSDCDCDECLEDAVPGFAPGETIELDEISLYLLSVSETAVRLQMIATEVDEWAIALRRLTKAPRTHHVRVFRELHPNDGYTLDNK